jgi:hypothetical protein
MGGVVARFVALFFWASLEDIADGLRIQEDPLLIFGQHLSCLRICDGILSHPVLRTKPDIHHM